MNKNIERINILKAVLYFLIGILLLFNFLRYIYLSPNPENCAPGMIFFPFIAYFGTLILWKGIRALRPKKNRQDDIIEKHRSIGISIFAILFFALGYILMIANQYLFLQPAAKKPPYFITATNGLVSIGYFFVGIGCWKLFKGTRESIFIIVSINLISTIIEQYTLLNKVSLGYIVSILIFYFLWFFSILFFFTRSKVKEQFK